MNKLAIDASAMVARCLSEQGWHPLEGHALLAPPIAFSETSSVLHEAAWRGEITPERAMRARALLASAPVRVHISTQILRDAWDIADRLGWAKTYDAEYVALARRLACPLLTLDERLRRGAGSLVQILGPAEL